MPTDFEEQSYWHERFKSETSFEWLAPSSVFMDVLRPRLQHLPKSARILQVGPGTSDLHNHLRNEGFVRVTNVDYEPLAIQRGQQLEEDVFGDVQMEYLVGDATRLDLDEKYQVVIDKSTADAVSCRGSDAVVAMAEGIYRCLERGGFWVSLSFSQSRFEHVRSMFDVEVIGKLATPKARPNDPDIFYYYYLLRPQ
ncbi:hypothetical protein VTK26DRAFT_1140 [Humicola hyalothermophila]